MTTTYLVKVTDSTPDYLEYGSYRGWVVIDDSGQWERNATDDEVNQLGQAGLLDYEKDFTDGNYGPDAYRITK